MTRRKRERREPFQLRAIETPCVPRAGSADPRLVAYMRAGHVYAIAGGPACDELDPERPRVGPVDARTDGTWAWSSVLTHYVERYNVALSLEFMEHVIANGFRVPPKDMLSPEARQLFGAERPPPPR